MSKKLERLTGIAQMIADADLASLKLAEEARNRIEQEARTLREARTEAWRREAADIAHLTGQVQRWDDWSNARLKWLTQKQALAAAEAVTRKAVAARAFGRVQAIRALSVKELKAGRPKHGSG